MVQRELTPAEMFWIVEQSLKTPPHVAAALFAAGMFSNYLEAAGQVDAALPALTIIAEHWADTAVAFLGKHCPNTRTAVLGGHMMFLGIPGAVQPDPGGFPGNAVAQAGLLSVWDAHRHSGNGTDVVSLSQHPLSHSRNVDPPQALQRIRGNNGFDLPLGGSILHEAAVKSVASSNPL
jgi:hypothetical protein